MVWKPGRNDSRTYCLFFVWSRDQTEWILRNLPGEIYVVINGGVVTSCYQFELRLINFEELLVLHIAHK